MNLCVCPSWLWVQLCFHEEHQENVSSDRRGKNSKKPTEPTQMMKNFGPLHGAVQSFNQHINENSVGVDSESKWINPDARKAFWTALWRAQKPQAQRFIDFLRRDLASLSAP